MIDQAGAFAMDHFFVISILFIVVLTSIGYSAERTRQENERAERQLAEVDNYDPEEPVGM